MGRFYQPTIKRGHQPKIYCFFSSRHGGRLEASGNVFGNTLYMECCSSHFAKTPSGNRRGVVDDEIRRHRVIPFLSCKTRAQILLGHCYHNTRRKRFLKVSIRPAYYDQLINSNAPQTIPNVY